MEYTSTLYGCVDTNYTKFTAVPRPAETMFLGEANDVTSYSWGCAIFCPMCTYDRVVGGEVNYMYPILNSCDWAETNIWGAISCRHMQGANYAQVDGHAQWQPYARVTKGIRVGSTDKEIMWCKAFWGHGDPDDADPCV